MIWHDHVSVDAQVFVRVTKSEAVVDDFDLFGIYKNRQPVNKCESDKININAVDEFVTVHRAIIFEKFLSDQDNRDLVKTLANR